MTIKAQKNLDISVNDAYVAINEMEEKTYPAVGLMLVLITSLLFWGSFAYVVWRMTR